MRLLLIVCTVLGGGSWGSITADRGVLLHLDT